jgi:hypothetical protein
MIRSSEAAAWLFIVVVMVQAPGLVHAQPDGMKAQRDRTRFIDHTSSWLLRLPVETHVLYKGAASFDTVGGPRYSGLYPAPNVAGFLAAVITHGVMVEASQARQRKQIQDAADRVLAPYQAILGDFTYRALMQSALEKIATDDSVKVIEPTADAGSAWLVESSPVFWMTQDRRAIVLGNSVTIFRPNTPAAAAYKNTIKVVSDAHEPREVGDLWGDNEGRKLKDESANLLAQSLEIAMREATQAPSKEDAVHRTFRYTEGHREKMERGQLISERCDRIVMRNLRGWIMSIPVTASTASPPTQGCGTSSARPLQSSSESTTRQSEPPVSQ